MIDEEEEDVEKILKRKISWKKVLKGILGFILLGGGFVLIQLSQASGSINPTYFILAIFLICMSSSVLVQIPKKTKEVRHTISVLQCQKCGVERVNDYKDGDYVFKDTGISCPNCDSTFKILKVYSLKLKSKGKIKTK